MYTQSHAVLNQISLRLMPKSADENLAAMRAQDNLECLPASHMSKSLEHLLLFKAS
jgi:hypothetical protein